MRNDTIGTKILVTIFVSLLACGCGEKYEVPATARKSVNQPVFEKAVEATAAETTVNEQPLTGGLKFLNRDHFGCLKIAVDVLKSSGSLRDVPWADLDVAIGKLIGDAAPSQDVNSIYLIFDSQLLKFEDFQQCMGFMVEFKSETVVSLNDENESSLKSSEGDPNDENIRRILEPNLIAYGPKELVAKLSATHSGQSDVANKISEFVQDKSLAGAVSLRPIRSALKGVFSLLATQPQLQAYSDLPDDIETLSFSLDFDDESDFFESVLEISNPELQKKIIQSVNQLMADPNGIPELPSQIPGAESMLESNSPQILLSILSEVVEEGLFSVSDNTEQLRFRLSRPKGFDELVASSVQDYAKQVNLSYRINNAKRVAEALKKYHEKHGVLPPIGAVTPDSELPEQFNWKTGLLPFLSPGQLPSFDFAETWNSDKNQNTAELIEGQLKSENDGQFPLNSIEMVKGPKRIYTELESGPKMDSIRDRKNWTAIAVEQPESKSDWFAPVSEFSVTDSDQIGVEDETGILAITASFKVRILKKSARKAEAFLTIDGDERFARTDFLNVNE